MSRPEDGYINATQLCQAGCKMLIHWKENKKSQEFLLELSGSIGIPIDLLIKVISDGPNEFRATWVHPKVAINIAQWISPKFAVQVSEWIYELLSTGSIKIERPIKAFQSLSEIDIEAEILEQSIESDFTKLSNELCLYMAYVGNGLVKIGYSDSRLIQRNKKHQSSESQYSQWRIIGLFQISGKPIEKITHEFLSTYKFEFQKQKEIYKPSKTLKDFKDIVSLFLKENDLKLQVVKLSSENIHLKNELEKALLKIKIYELENKSLV